MTEDQLYQGVVKVSRDLWPFRPISSLAARYDMGMEPRVDPPDPEPEELFCPVHPFVSLVEQDWQAGTGKCPVCGSVVGGVTLRDIEDEDDRSLQE